MKYLAVCLLTLHASLISAELDIFDETKKSSLFAPLSDEVRPILFQHFDEFEFLTLRKMSKLNLSEQILFLSQFRHSYSEIGTSSLNFTLQGIDWLENVNFYVDLLNFIDLVTDTEILYNTSMQYYQEIEDISNINWKNSLKYKNYLRFTDEEWHYSSIGDIEDNILNKDIEQRKNKETFLKKLYKTIQQNICSFQTSPQQAMGNFLGHVRLYVVQRKLTYYLNTKISEKIKEYYQWDLKLDSYTDYMYSIVIDFFFRARRGLTESQEFSPRLPLKPVEGSTYVILRNPFQDFTSDELEEKCHLSPRPYCNFINHNADRYISLKPVYSNIYNDSVITGIRFVEQDHILHIQIQQGQLLQNGNINSTTVAWVPIDDNMTCGLSGDCYYLNSNGPHIIDLGDSVIDAYGSKIKKVLTGIRITDEYNQGRLHLQVYSTPFDFTTGKVITDIESDTQVPVEKKNYKVHEGNNTVTLTTSTARDGTEEMSPYIDIQPVETRPPSAMVGAGIYTRTINGKELLSLKLFTYDIGLFAK